VAADEQLSKSKAVRDLEESLIKQKQASLDIAQLSLSYTKLYSSSDGYVTKRSVEVGNQVQAGQPLMAVVDLGDIWLVANYKETQLERVKAGQDVTIQIDTYPGKVFKGKVDSVMAGTGAAFSLFPAENALGNYVKVVQRVPVKITFDKTGVRTASCVSACPACRPSSPNEQMDHRFNGHPPDPSRGH